MRDKVFRKGLVVGIIMLFIGVTIASGITFKVNSSKTIRTDVINNELVKIPVSICRFDGDENYEVFLTRQQDNELDDLINKIKFDLDNVKTIEETTVIFHNVIESFDELGILPDDMSIDETQQLVTGRIFNIEPKTSIGNKNTLFQNAGFYNINCYLFARASESGRAYLFSTFIFGYKCYDPDGGNHYYPAVGWVWTNGLLGIKELEGSFRGGIRESLLGFTNGLIDGPCSGYVGTVNFIGFYLREKDLILGYALIARFEYWSP